MKISRRKICRTTVNVLYYDFGFTGGLRKPETKKKVLKLLCGIETDKTGQCRIFLEDYTSCENKCPFYFLDIPDLNNKLEKIDLVLKNFGKHFLFRLIKG